MEFTFEIVISPWRHHGLQVRNFRVFKASNPLKTYYGVSNNYHYYHYYHIYNMNWFKMKRCDRNSTTGRYHINMIEIIYLLTLFAVEGVVSSAILNNFIKHFLKTNRLISKLGVFLFGDNFFCPHSS